jgi:hypothetical protein
VAESPEKTERGLRRAWYCGPFHSASYLRDQCSGRFALERTTMKYPGTISEGMFRLDRSAFDGETERSGREAERVGRFGQVHPAF